MVATNNFFCPGIEADCGTEPIQTSDHARSSIIRKLAQYLAIDAQGIYRTHFGFPNFYVPLITTSTARTASNMAALDRLTAGRGSKIFLFKTLPAITLSAAPPPPSGHMLTEEWQWVGYPPFNFLTSCAPPWANVLGLELIFLLFASTRPALAEHVFTSSCATTSTTSGAR